MADKKHTHWGIEYRTNSSGRRWGWHLSLQSIRRTRYEAQQAALDHFVSLGPTDKRWDEWHALRAAGRIRAVKLSIATAGGGS